MKSDCGSDKSGVLAVLRLITNWKSIGRSIGGSPGGVPLRIVSM